MARFRHSVKSLTTLVCASLLLPQFSAAFDRTSKWWLQGDLEAGFQQIDPKVANELSKSGMLLGGRGLLEYRSDSWGAFGAGLGVQQTWQDGETDVRYQQYILRSLFLDGSYLYPFMNRFLWVGWIVRTQVGEGARFDFFGSMDKVEGLLTTGPQIRLNFATEKWDWVVGAMALTALNSSNRNILTIPVYAGISIPLSKGEAATSESQALPAQDVFITAEVRTRIIRFDLDQSLLKPEAIEYLNKLSRVLVEHNSSWVSLNITGHTDITGQEKRNQKLSESRAVAIKRFLTQKGVPAAKITTAGRSAGQLISGVESESPLHRRAELSFEGITGQKLNKALNALQGAE